MTAPHAIEAESDRLRAALTYAKRCWPVAPAHSIRRDGLCSCGDKGCDRQGKHPRTLHGLSDATLDEAKIREWWTQWPDANVLIRTGKVGERYLTVLDVDPKSGGLESFAEVIAENGDFPDTPRCKTGGGGFHIFTWSHHPVASSVGKIGPGLDVRGVGGYVIAAGSNHISGRSYEWEADAHPAQVQLAEAPAWFVAVAGLSRSRAKVVDPGPQGDFIIGQRNDALTKIAGAMRRPGVGEKALLAALTIINADRCVPPLDDWEVEKIARSVARYIPGDAVTSTSEDAFELLSAADMATELPPIKWTVEGLGIAPGGVTVVGGAGYGGKTMAMQELVLSVASGRPVFGKFPVEQGRAVHLDFEQGRRVTQERYQRLAKSKGIDLASLPPGALGVCCLPKKQFKNDKASEEAMVRICTDAKVCVIDAFRGAFPDADENSSAVRGCIDMLQRVSDRTGCSIIVVAHSNKPREGVDVRNSLRGSGAIFDAAQTVYMFEGVPGKSTRVHCTKDRVLGMTRETFGLRVTDQSKDDNARWGLSVDYVQPTDTQAEYIEASAPEERVIDLRLNAARMSTLAAKVREQLEAAPAGMTMAGLRSFTGCNALHMTAVIQEMMRYGTLRHDGGGASGLYSLTSTTG